MSSLPAPYAERESVRSLRVVEAPAVPTVVARREDFPMYELSSLMEAVFSHLAQALEEQGLTVIGPAFALHHRWPVDTADLEVGFPVAGELAEELELPSGVRVQMSQLPAGRVAQVSHCGAYGGLADAWGAFAAAVGEQGEQMTFPFWEMYVTAPGPDVDPDQQRTDLFSALEH